MWSFLSERERKWFVLTRHIQVFIKIVQRNERSFLVFFVFFQIYFFVCVECCEFIWRNTSQCSCGQYLEQGVSPVECVPWHHKLSKSTPRSSACCDISLYSRPLSQVSRKHTYNTHLRLKHCAWKYILRAHIFSVSLVVYCPLCELKWLIERERESHWVGEGGPFEGVEWRVLLLVLPFLHGLTNFTVFKVGETRRKNRQGDLPGWLLRVCVCVEWPNWVLRNLSNAAYWPEEEKERGH